jgi:hypothetical protein
LNGWLAGAPLIEGCFFKAALIPYYHHYCLRNASAVTTFLLIGQSNFYGAVFLQQVYNVS